MNGQRAPGLLNMTCGAYSQAQCLDERKKIMQEWANITGRNLYPPGENEITRHRTMSAPSRLYKYASSESAKKILTNTSLKWSSPLEFNDPEELQKKPTLSPSIEDSLAKYIDKILTCAFHSKKNNTKNYSEDFADVAEAAKVAIKQGIKKDHLRHSFPKLDITCKIIDKLHSSVTNAFDSNKLRILCLTEDGNNDKMWAQYASQSTGCCLEFNSEASAKSYFKLAKKVIYCDSTPAVGSAYDMLIYGVPDNIEEISIESLYYTKSTRFEHENEWRLTFSATDNTEKPSDCYMFHPQDITSITFGCKTETHTIDTLSDIAVQKYSHIKIFKTEIKDGKTQFIRIK